MILMLAFLSCALDAPFLGALFIAIHWVDESC